jgi:hypothetical protein
MRVIMKERDIMKETKVAIKDILRERAADFVDSAHGGQVCVIEIFQDDRQNIDGQVGGHISAGFGSGVGFFARVVVVCDCKL